MYMRPLFIPLQWYFICDRIPLAWDKNKGDGPSYIPAYARSVNFRTGLNLAFGWNRKIKKIKDKPLVDI